MKYDIYNPYPNQSVTSYYVKVIESALKQIGHTTEAVSSLLRSADKCEKGVVVVVSTDATKAKKAGYKKVVLWIQGISPEESYMRNHSKIRSAILSRFEKEGVKSAGFVFFVSKAMKDHYINKYGLTFAKSIVMPCFNNEIDDSYFYTDKKYENNTFIYAGALDVWQCFEQTVQLYKQIENQVENANFRVLTKDRDTAEKVLRENGVRHYSLGFVPQEQIGTEMARAKFGFCLRQDMTVNRVATPTKLSTYVSHGVIPIYSDCILDFHEKAKNNPYCCSIPSVQEYFSSNTVKEIVTLCYKTIESDSVLQAFRNSFGQYYSKEYYIEKIVKQVLDWMGK